MTHRHTPHRLLDLLEDILRAILASAALTYIISTQASLLAQTSGVEVSMVESALKQGGLFALIVLVMFFYRRDWAKLNDYQKNYNDRLIAVIESNTAVLTGVRDELRLCGFKR